ncbi:unnamed protein product, partial [marine sediment metagenome]
IYVVIGMAGEYEDRMEWPIVAFSKENSAIKYVEKATRRAEEWFDIVGNTIN